MIFPTRRSMSSEKESELGSGAIIRFIIGWGVWLLVSSLALYNLRLLFDLPAEYRESVIQFLGVVATLAVGAAAAMVAFLQKRTADRQAEIANRQAYEATLNAKRQLEILNRETHIAAESHRLSLFEKRMEVVDAIESYFGKLGEEGSHTWEDCMPLVRSAISRSKLLFGNDVVKKLIELEELTKDLVDIEAKLLRINNSLYPDEELKERLMDDLTEWHGADSVLWQHEFNALIEGYMRFEDRAPLKL